MFADFPVPSFCGQDMLDSVGGGGVACAAHGGEGWENGTENRVQPISANFSVIFVRIVCYSAACAIHCGILYDLNAFD